MSRDDVSTAAALIIGTELLTGKVRDENMDGLARTLRSIGVQLRRAVFVEDELEVIAEEVSTLSRNHDVLFTSGGIGPTHDDLTIDAVAEAFGVQVVLDPRFADLIRSAYGDSCTDSHLRMARIPKGAELVSADGIVWPTVVMHNVWVMPGVPQIFRMKLSAVRQRLKGPVQFLSRAVYTQVEESELKPLLDKIVESHTEVQVGSYPKWFDISYKTKVTLDAVSEAVLEAALDDLLGLLPSGEPVRIE
jgi:molybdenum cofactor synthesis domain-containing protein